jgi:hypothetical protein
MKQKYETGDIVVIKHKDKNQGVFGCTEIEGIFIDITNLGCDEEPFFVIEVDALWITGYYRKMYFDIKTKNLIGYPDEWFIK